MTAYEVLSSSESTMNDGDKFTTITIPAFCSLKNNHPEVQVELQLPQLALVEEKATQAVRECEKVKLLQHQQQFLLSWTLRSQLHARNASASSSWEARTANK